MMGMLVYGALVVGAIAVLAVVIVAVVLVLQRRSRSKLPPQTHAAAHASGTGVPPAPAGQAPGHAAPPGHAPARSDQPAQPAPQGETQNRSGLQPPG